MKGSILFWAGIASTFCLPAANWQSSGAASLATAASQVSSAHASQSASNSPSITAAAQHRAVLNRYCVTCHNERMRTAGLSLEKADLEKVTEGAEVWEKVVWKLRTGVMPPAGAPRPEQAAYDSFAAYLETALDGASAVRPNPGRTTVHRLNRVEYTNAIRDLLAVDFDAESLLPADDSGHGFDNLAALLSVSPVLMERYISAARKISHLAVGEQAVNAEKMFSRETYRLPRRQVQDDRLSDDLPLGSRGGIAIRHRFPLDGEYLLKIRLQRERNGYIKGLLGEPHQLDVLVDGARIKKFMVGGERHGASASIQTRRQGKYYESEPEQQKYETIWDIDNLQVRFQAKAGTRLVGVVFLKKTLEPEGLLEVHPRPLQPDLDELDTGYKGGDPAVDDVTIIGPYEAKGAGDTPSRRRIFVCRPDRSEGESSIQLVSAMRGKGKDDDEDADSCAAKILSNLARRAYRRPITSRDIQGLMKLYRGGRNNGDFEAGIRMALQGILVSPEFLFRIEGDPPNVAPDTAFPVSEMDLASRLSFFLWSSSPDDVLLDLAERGKLRDPGVLEQQVRRMLADYRSRAMASNFAGQWLYLRNLRSVTPDPKEFPDFDEELRQAMHQETELFFKSLLREDRSVPDLLNADYTFVNERLAQHYGIPNIYGSTFRRITLTGDNRKGLLGHGSILTVTSRASRTAPVLRGKWVLENLLGTPPPPPPPDIPPLNEKKEEVKNLTMRQRMEQHRANPVCAGCHARMDPIGFALEGFDAVGKWRTADGRNPIDMSGVFPDGAKFQGPAELRKVLLRRPEQFVHAVTEKLLTYALGRDLQYYDAPAVRKIVREAEAGGYRWSSVILGIIKSTPFQMRRSRPS